MNQIFYLKKRCRCRRTKHPVLSFNIHTRNSVKYRILFRLKGDKKALKAPTALGLLKCLFRKLNGIKLGVVMINT